MTAMVCSCFIFSVDGHLSFPPLVLFSPLVAVLDTAESPHRQGNRGSSNPRLTGAWVVSGRAPVQTQPCDLPLLTPTPPPWPASCHFSFLGLRGQSHFLEAGTPVKISAYRGTSTPKLLSQSHCGLLLCSLVLLGTPTPRAKLPVNCTRRRPGWHHQVTPSAVF